MRARQANAGTVELAGVDHRLAHVWTRWLDGNLSLAVKPIGRRSSDETLQALLTDARTLRLDSLVGVLEARFRRLAFIAAQAMSSSAAPTASTSTVTPVVQAAPQPRSGGGRRAARSGAVAYQPASRSHVATTGLAVAQLADDLLVARTGLAVAQPASASSGVAVAGSSLGAGGAGKRKKQRGGKGYVASANASPPVLPSNASRPSGSAAGRRSAQQVFWTHEPLLQTLRAAMWDSLEGHVALSQVNGALRWLYTGKGDPDDHESELLWRELCGRRGFGIPRHWRRHVPPQAWRRTAAAVVYHAQHCSLVRCAQVLRLPRAVDFFYAQR